MYLNDIALQLGCNWKTFADTYQAPDIYTVHFLSEPVSEPDKTCLYFVDKALPESYDTAEMNLAFSEAIPLPRRFRSVLLLSPTQTVKKAFAFVQELLTNNMRRMRDRVHLMEALINAVDIQTFVNLCAEVFENAVTIGGMRHQLIAHSTNYTAPGVLWDEHEQLGHFSEETIHTSGYKQTENLIQKSSEPLLLRQPITGRMTITGKIIAYDVQVGYLSVINTNRTFSEDDRQMVKTICELLGAQFPMITSASAVSQCSKLVQILLDDYNAPDHILPIGFERLAFDGTYRVLLLQRNNQKEISTPLATVIALLVELFPNQIVAQYQASIVVVLSADPDLHQYTASVLEQFLNEHGYITGISCLLSKENTFKICYEQALKAIEFGMKLERNRTIFYYEEYISFHLWETLSMVLDLRYYCHSAVFKLIDYDEIHRTHLSDTLWAFLISCGNKTQTAKELSIHKSTLLRRLDKIQEVAPVNLESPKVQALLYSTFQILTLLDL